MTPAQLMMAALTAVAAALYAIGRRRARALAQAVLVALAAYAIVQIGVALFLFANHAPAEFNLEAMESTILGHVRRLMSGEPLYATPTPQFGALAYNPLYYVVSVPFVWVFGSNLLALRLSAIVATVASGLLIARIVARATGSRLWGLFAAGLFAAAYRVMDCYLDMAHADAWLVLAILLGAHLIESSRSRTRDAVGMAVLVAAFWFKQHGALFAAGGLVYVVWCGGWRRAWPALAVAVVLGPLLYAMAPAFFGSQFHHYTWVVPRRWMRLDGEALARLAGHVAVAYPLLGALGLGGAIAAFRTRRPAIWFALLPVALLSGLLGALDHDSLDNVFIPLGVWIVVTGTIALKQLAGRYAAVERWGGAVAILGFSWTLLAYAPGDVMVSPDAEHARQDLIAYVRALDGPVYAPMFGPLPVDNPFRPALHWVALEDLVRRPGADERNHPLVRRLLDPVVHPHGTAYVLTDSPLADDALLEFLGRDYTLQADLGERFDALAELPRRIEIGGPRYLYRRAATGSAAPH